jgi:DNA topoisomerase II
MPTCHSAKAASERVACCPVQLDERTMQVTELPVRRWTQDYKEFLEGLIKPDNNEVPPARSICK